MTESIQIPGYEPIGQVAEGGMGSIFKARQTSIDRIVAVKLLKAEYSQDGDFVRRFLREVRLAARISHPNVVMAYDAGEANGVYYYVMEYVQGKNVLQLINEKRKMRESEALSIFRQMLEALTVLDNHNLLHRDIKPENIIVTPEGTAKLCDLGLARPAASGDPRMTQPGMVMGTPLYLAPEQINAAEDVDIRSDIYSLGATLFHMVCGRAPYPGNTPSAVLAAHLKAPVPDPKPLAPTLSDKVAQVIKTCLQKDPNHRFRNAREVLQALDAPEPKAASRKTSRATRRPATIAVSRRKKERPSASGTPIGAILAIVVIGGIGLLILLSSNSGSRHRPRPRPTGPGVPPPPITGGPRTPERPFSIKEVEKLFADHRWDETLSAIRKLRVTSSPTPQQQGRLQSMIKTCRSEIEKRDKTIAGFEEEAAQAVEKKNWPEAEKLYAEILKVPGLTDSMKERYDGLHQQARRHNEQAGRIERMRGFLKEAKWVEALEEAERLPEDWKGPEGTKAELTGMLRREKDAIDALAAARTHAKAESWEVFERQIALLQGNLSKTVTARTAEEEIASLVAARKVAAQNMKEREALKLVQEGDKAFDEGKLSSAREIYRRVLAEYPALATVEERRIDIENRIQTCTQSLARNLEDRAAFTFAIGEVFFLEENWSEALLRYRALLSEFKETEYSKRNRRVIEKRIQRCEKGK